MAERVARGAALLDEKEPGWWERIDLDALNLHSACQCVLGQLETDLSYSTMVERVGLRRVWMSYERRRGTDAGYGFNAYHPQKPEQYDRLTAEWKRVITERRAAS